MNGTPGSGKVNRRYLESLQWEEDSGKRKKYMGP